ncbi:MAG TPA: hypothetical protein VHE61_03295 [Opitutaceae bacterium]|nr:hypothetical protein [Opitutaceae bacterium]
MSFAEFRQAIASDSVPPASLSPALRALWHDARGSWEDAHAAAQSDSGPDAAWAHAYLHRKEGDRSNAGYWYRRAGRIMPDASVGFDAEWADLAQTLLRE